MNELVWSSSVAKVTGGNRSTRRNPCPVFTLATINPTWTGLG